MGVGPGMFGTKDQWICLLITLGLICGVMCIGLWEGCKFVVRHIDVTIERQK